MSVSEKDIQARRESFSLGGSLSAEAIEKNDKAIAYLQSRGFSFDHSTRLVQLSGADAILEQKAASEAHVEEDLGDA